jgi:hypothetical protein
MKRRILFLLLLTASVSLWAQTSRRNIEFGFDARWGFANNYLSAGQILRETITVDLTTMADDLGDGYSIFTGGGGDVFLNVRGVNFGAGWFAGVDGSGYFKIPHSLIKLITRGNTEDNYSGHFEIGAAAFAETGVWASARIIKNLNISIRPSYFLPLAYMVSKDASYSLDTYPEAAGDYRAGDIHATGTLSAKMYTPFPIGDDGDIDAGNIDIGSLIGKGGADLTLGVEYPLFPNLILGATLTHIPLVPARLSDGYDINANFEYYENAQDMLEETDDGATGGREKGMTYDEPSFDSFFGSERKIFRPFKLGVNALYRPFFVRFFALKPSAALVFNGVYEAPVYLDFGGAAEINLRDIFIVDAGIHFEDLIWRHSLGLIFNMRAMELDLGISMQSQDLLKSFQVAGVRVDVGVRFGW